MTHTFTDALAIVLQQEGGYVNDPRDPGGMTNLGVTARAWAAWTDQPATEAVMRALTPAVVVPFYKDQFWDKIDGDNLPVALALAVFNFAVNAGPGHAAKMLQCIVGCAQDGQIGPETCAAVNAYPDGLALLIKRFCDARLAYYHALPTFGTFGNGWTARVDRVCATALSWGQS